MNKTITINLSGIVFHIDENAYDTLRKYLEKLKSHFNATNGSEEIMADIESRIAEMFSERVTQIRTVIVMDDVNAVIEAMGNPDEVAGEEKAHQQTASASSSSSSSSDSSVASGKRFFRNIDEKIFGGVCSGIAAYFDFDPLWLRLAFALSFFFAGTGLILYLILWLIIPAARTTAEKLQMRGERVNISNIEKNIREEMGTVKEKFEEFGKTMSSDETKRKIKENSHKVGSFIGEVFTRFFQIIGKVIGFIITVFSIGALIGLTIVVFSLFGVFSVAFPTVLTQMIFTTGDLGWLITGAILVIGIPLVLLLLNGIKILFNVNLYLKRVGLIMLIFWLAGVAMATYQGVKVGKEFSKEGTNRQSEVLLSLIHI
jgi:phage shock protein PspC (stress-responsive transcriptional regulator)